MQTFWVTFFIKREIDYYLDDEYVSRRSEMPTLNDTADSLIFRVD